MPDDVIRLRAEWVFPVSGSPLRNGVVEVAGDRIVAVHDRSEPRAHDFVGCAILPGLVNAHTHLEFSSLTAPLAPAVPFTDWLRAVIGWRRERNALPGPDVADGFGQAWGGGTTLIGEIASQGWDPAAVPKIGPRVIAFQEALGLRPAVRDEQLARARSFLADKSTAAHVTRGLSPHAPYSLHPDLFRGLVALANEFQAPLAMHLAETTAEGELLRHGRGEFVPFLERLGVWDSSAIPTGTRVLDYLRDLESLSHALVVHGNYLDQDEQQFLAGKENFTVVYCPRTHAYFGHSPHPWQELQDRGTRVALGTDSRASNPDLSLWEELRFLRRKFPRVAPEILLRMATVYGAEALGQGTETGTLEPGKRADLLIVPLDSQALSDPYSHWLEQPLKNPLTVSGGHWNCGANWRMLAPR